MEKVDRTSTPASGLALLLVGCGQATAAGGGKTEGAKGFKRKILLKIIFGLWSILIVCSPFGRVAAAAAGHHYKFCNGYFALCAASTCTPTGGTVTVNVTKGGTADFPEADCTCPIFYGQAIADVNGGTMSGSCKPPSKDELWSIYTRTKYIPQAINGWAQSGPAAAAPKQICPASLNLGDDSVNCFGFVCDSEAFINGVPVATCHCALGESLEGTAVPPHTAFWTDAGQGDQGFCAAYPAAVPISLPAVLFWLP